MKKTLAKNPYLIFFVIIAGLIGALGYLGYQNYLLKQNKIFLETEFASTTKNLSNIIDLTETELSKTEEERDIFEQNFLSEKARMDFLSAQVESIQDAVGILEKISATDSELLQKYSKVYFLNEHYVPQNLTSIGKEYLYEPGEETMIHTDVWPFLENLLDGASASGVDILILSGYRSFGEQSGLKSSYIFTYGVGTANQFSADQGYSEHQLGTTMDFTTSSTGGVFSSFEKTEAYEWLTNNAYKYGFTLSYPENNNYFMFEPWHWRFVGRDLAEKLHAEGKYFYDLDQREIDTYLQYFFD